MSFSSPPTGSGCCAGGAGCVVLREAGSVTGEELAEYLSTRLAKFKIPRRWLFLDALPRSHRYTFEFRDPSWHDPAVYRALGRHNVAFCLYELDGFEAPYQLTADFVYVRLHGSGRKYQGDYSSQQLRDWARRIARWRQRLKAVYVYFDNDQAGYAAKNAAELKSMVTQ